MYKPKGYVFSHDDMTLEDYLKIKMAEDENITIRIDLYDWRDGADTSDDNNIFTVVLPFGASAYELGLNSDALNAVITDIRSKEVNSLPAVEIDASIFD